MKWSRNGYAETLLTAMAPAGEPATGTRGLETLRTTLAAFGLPPAATSRATARGCRVTTTSRRTR